MSIAERLKQLGITITDVVPPVGSYVPAVQIGDLVLTSGQLPMVGGELFAKGKVPVDVPLERAREAARMAMINALGAVCSVIGDLQRVERVVRVAVFVNSSPGFFDQPKVANGASDLLVEIFGENGRHVRAAVGAAELPLNAAVEVELAVKVQKSKSETST